MLPTWLFLVCLPVLWWARSAERMLVVFFVSCVFGAAAVLTVVALGSAPVTPALFFLPFLALALVRATGWRTVLNGLSWRGPGIWLALFVSWAVFTAIFMPRLFAGKTLVYTTSRGDSHELGVQLNWLAPNSTNLTQSIYLVIGLASFLVVRALIADPNLRKFLFRALCAVAICNVLFVLIDGIGRLLGVDMGLWLVRNANYGIVEQAVGGIPRLQGAMAEPSSLAGFAVGVYGVFLMLWLQNYRAKLTGALAVVNGLALLLTQSSTAFVSFGAVSVAAVSLQLLFGWSSKERFRLGFASVLLSLAVCLAGVMLLWMPPWFERFLDIVYAMTFDKANSESGEERLAWVQSTWQNFLDTYGLGSGAGSARSSSFIFVVLGNTGVPGTLTFLAFLAVCLFWPAQGLDDDEAKLLLALRVGLFGLLAAAALAGTMIDRGAFFNALAGAIAGLMVSTRQRVGLDAGVGWSDSRVHDPASQFPNWSTAVKLGPRPANG